MNFPVLATACLATIGLGLGQAARAENVIDQNQALTNVSVSGSYGPGTYAAQSFQQTADNISGAGVSIDFQAPSTVTVSLWDGLPGSGSMLATGDKSFTAGGWADVFWNPVQTLTDTAYSLVLTGVALYRGSTDVYAHGQVFTQTNGFSYDDLVFRTYASVASVPEPADAVLMLAGLGVLLPLSRRMTSRARAG